MDPGVLLFKCGTELFVDKAGDPELKGFISTCKQKLHNEK